MASHEPNDAMNTLEKQLLADRELIELRKECARLRREMEVMRAAEQLRREYNLSAPIPFLLQKQAG